MHSEQQQNFSGRAIKLMPFAVLICAVFAAYANIYGNAFVYDDALLITGNPALASWPAFFSSLAAPLTFDSSYYRPLQLLLYKIIFQFAGLSLFSFHFLNVSLHAANACLVYRLGKKLSFNPAASFLAALIWALHPLQTEAITYMSATADPLYSLFCLLAALALLPDFTPRRLTAASALMLLGLLSKESAITFPLLAASLLYLQKDKRFDIKTYLRLWPLVFTAALYLALRYVLLPPHAVGAASGDPLPPSLTAYPVAAFPTYLRLLFWPAHLHMGYDLPAFSAPWHAAVIAGTTLILLALIQILCNTRPRVLAFNWGLCWFAAAYAPCLFTAALFYEHWLYLPSAGLFLGAAQSLSLLPARAATTRAALAFSLLAAALIGLLTYLKNDIGRAPAAFYMNTINQGERAVKQHINLGVLYAERGEYERAIAEDRVAIVNSHDTEALAEANLAAALLMLPDRAQHAGEAEQHFKRALAIDPRLYAAMDALAVFYAEQGDAAQADFYHKRSQATRKQQP